MIGLLRLLSLSPHATVAGTLQIVSIVIEMTHRNDHARNNPVHPTFNSQTLFLSFEIYLQFYANVIPDGGDES